MGAGRATRTVQCSQAIDGVGARPLLYRWIARFVTRTGGAASLGAVALALAVANAHPALSAAADGAPGEPAGLLKGLGFGDGDVRALERGEVISRGMDGSASAEIAVAGAVLVRVPRAYFVDRLRDIVDFKQDDIVLEIGVFDGKPSTSQLDGLTLSSDDLHALSRCRPGDCSVKLPAPAIETFRRDVNWGDGDAARQATRAFKTMLVQRTDRFLEGGPDAVEPYADGHSQPFAAEVRGLLDASADLYRYAPAFRDSIAGAPDEAAPGVEAVTYWSKEKAAFKPIISLTHMSFVTTEAAGTTLTYGSSINFYSSHYLDASLGATVAVSPPDEPGAVYVIYVNRSRVDALNGLFSGLRRWGVQREARGGLKDRLEETRRRLESEYAGTR
jgi:hypothetical protein